MSVPASGQNPVRKRSARARRGLPESVNARKRRLNRSERDDLQNWLERLPKGLLANLYKGLGGQPNRISSDDRMVQLAVKALGQGTRLTGLLKQLHERDRKALATLVQCGGIGHHEELLRELSVSYGGHEREWRKVLQLLANRGLVMATPPQDDAFYYLLPGPISDLLLDTLGEELALPTFEHPDVRIIEHQAFCPPLDFSITSLATYIDQSAPRLTQRHEVYRHDQEAMDQFFGQLWKPDSELFQYHLDFLMMHGIVELRGETLSLNRDAMEEFLLLDPEDQRDLLFRALNKRFPNGEWVLWAIQSAGEAWIAERPLADLYRRWKKGDDWSERYSRGMYGAGRSNERESFSFAPLVRIGLLEMGEWGQGKFYRLSPRGRTLLEPPEDDGFKQFYLTPSFEIMAPAGLAPVLLFRIGELAELTGCDRANTYKITEPQVQASLERGWRRDDILQFLRDNSQIGVPDNVEATLKGWIGHQGDVEFHDLMVITVHRSQIRRLEGNKRLKPYLLHRFAPGMYAIDRSRKDEIERVLAESGFSPRNDVRNYPGDPEQVEARKNLHRLVHQAREEAMGDGGIEVLVPAEQLNAVPGTKRSGKKVPKPKLPPKIEPEEVRPMLERAMSAYKDVEMLYLEKTGKKTVFVVEPLRVALKANQHMLVALDRESKDNKTFALARIERLRIIEESGQ